MIDTKYVNLSIYNGIPHLLLPVVTDANKALAALHWALAESKERYRKFADFGVKDWRSRFGEVQQNSGRELRI